jgi:hypothetical protein
VDNPWLSLWDKQLPLTVDISCAIRRYLQNMYCLPMSTYLIIETSSRHACSGIVHAGGGLM